MPTDCARVHTLAGNSDLCKQVGVASGTGLTRSSVAILSELLALPSSMVRAERVRSVWTPDCLVLVGDGVLC